MSIKPWTTKSTQTIFSTPFVSVNSNVVKLPNGIVIPDFFTVSIHDAALIVAITDQNDVILVREYRFACKEVVIECPAGMVEESESPLETAKRELLEETGYVSYDWTYLGPTFESTSKLTNTMHLFLARDCAKEAEQKLEESEGDIEIEIVPLEDAVQMVIDGIIKANSSAHAILKVSKLL